MAGALPLVVGASAAAGAAAQRPPLPPPCRELWDSLPSVFVGMPCQLLPTAQLLCEEVEMSFLEAGRPLPPWRTSGATISRWMSDCFSEMQVGGGWTPAARRCCACSCLQLAAAGGPCCPGSP